MKRIAEPPEPPQPSSRDDGASPPAPGPVPPSSAQTSSERSLETALQEQIWSGLALQTGPHAPVEAQRSGLARPAPAAPPPGEGDLRLVSTASVGAGAGPSAPASPRAVASSPRASGSYPSASGQRDVAIPRAPSAPGGAAPIPTSAEMPLGYVVASGFFLAIAVVGFGLWLAFEVISL
ncbi:MAG: hypothetical protein BGO98_10500 [Myxococcales bacterium 68-20]|nr:hypothetical protein [Myxococcales bacterium]OJY18074.1 MAG: hypothetical protein BGO98_10500 [Myxococcales bacterium 68-20]